MVSAGGDSPRLAVVGHLVCDRIVLPGGETTEALGGVSYNIAALTSLMKAGRLLPVCEVGEDIKSVLPETFGKSPVFDDSAVKYTSLPNVVNTLVYDSSGSRQEWNSRKPEPLSLVNIPENVDAVLFNFISGDDVTLDELEAFRKRFDGITYCDFHSLALGRSRAGKRFFRTHPRWREYLSPMDVVQMNLAEFATIADARGTMREAASRIGIVHENGPETVIITMGKGGFLLSENSGKEIYHVPAVQIPDEVDTTGCGDTLAAALIYHFTVSGDISQSAANANMHAAAKATFSGIDGFADIDRIISSLGPPVEPVRIF